MEKMVMMKYLEELVKIKYMAGKEKILFTEKMAMII